MNHGNHSFLHVVRLDDELHEIYASRFLRTFAYSLVDIFIPAFLISMGYSLTDVVLKYLIIHFLAVGLASPLAAWLESRVGMKHTVAIGSAMLLAFFAGLFTMASYHWPLPLLALISGSQAALYWMPFNTDFARCSKRNEIGKEIGFSELVPYAAAVAAPLTGASIITSLGFNALLATVAVFIALSSAVLFVTSEKRPAFRLQWRKIFSSRGNACFFAMFFCKGAVLGAAAVWPIFIYVLSKEYIVMGAAATVAGIGAGMLAFLIGVAADRIGKRRILLIGSLLGFASWMAATQASDINSLFIAAAAISASALAVEIPTFAATCERAKKQPLSEFMIFREFGLLAGRLFSLAPLVFILDFRIAFVLAGVLSLGFVFFKIPEK